MNFIRIFKKQKPTVLGRWSKLECDKALEQRIKLANIDNCGQCGLEYDKITFRYDKMSDKDLDVYMSFMYGS